jgi:nucleoside-diphosphate-sugar epimerase
MITAIDLVLAAIHHPFISFGLSIVLAVLYLVHINIGLERVPKEARQLSPKRWTEEEIRSTYQKVCENPVDFTPHLPPRLERRYVVVGGSGLVGGFIVLHLLARGQPPESIRIIDFRKPGREDMATGKAAMVQFFQADISSSSSTDDAFSQPWDPKFGSLPMTVYHTAAVIRFSEREKMFLYRSSAVNIDGTQNVLNAAKSAGADVFISTSTGSLALRRVNLWIAPWVRQARGMFQFYAEPNKDAAVRPHEEYFGNYAYSKAVAEKLVLDANSKNFRTGSIRPCCGVYGNKYDMLIGTYLKMGVVPTSVSLPLLHFALF